MNVRRRAAVACLLGWLLGGCAHPRWSERDPEAVRRKKAKPWVGMWTNVDARTRGVTEFAIDQKDQELEIEMWGKCHPRDCGWGTVTAVTPEAGRTNRIRAVWLTSFSEENQTLILSSGRIELRGRVHYIDDSGRVDRQYSAQFVRRNHP